MTVRASASSPSTTRCPAWVTAAATTRWRHPGSVRPSPSPRIADELAGEIVFLGTPGRGARQRQADHDRRRAVRRARRRPALPPVRPRPCREPPAGLRGRRGRVHRAAGPRLVRSLDGPQRPRRPDPAVQRRRPVAPAAPTDGPRPRDHPRRRDGREHHPGPDVGLVHDPQRRRVRLRADARAPSRRCAGAPRWPPGRRSTVTFSGCATTMVNNPVLAERFRANMARLRHRGHGRRPRTPAARTWPTSAGSARPSTPTSRSATSACRGTPSSSAMRRPRRAPTRPPCSRPRSSPRPRTTCSPTRRSSRRPGPRSGRDRRRSGR